jgi:hypothetical protein
MINPASDTGDAGDMVYGAYTAQFGGGLSATLALEQPRVTAVFNASATSIFQVTTGSGTTGNLGLPPASAAEANQWPDIVANLRVDQAWGSAQLMGAIHDVAGTYYAGTGVPAALTGSDAAGHPSDAIGWAIGAGIKLNAPMIGQGDYLQVQVNYAEGARKYVDFSYTNMYSMFNGGNYGIGLGSDGVFTTGSGIELTTAWGVNAAYEHFWNKNWQTSVYGAYTATSYDATANTSLCALETAGVAPAFSLAGATCNNNFQTWTIGTRTQFNIDSQTYLGVDVVYQELQTGLAGMNANYGNGAENALTGPRTVSNQSALMGQFRVHRNFYP